MNTLGLADSDLLVDISAQVELRQLFENSCHVELFRNPLYDIGWCANILNIIRLYTEARQKEQYIAMSSLPRY